MCENDSVGKKSEENPAVPAPVVPAGSGGVAKIFILTPEILQTLGLTSYTNARIASKNPTNAIKFSIPVVKDLQGTNADQKGSNKAVVTIGKLVEQSIGCTSVIKKPKTDGASAQNSNDTAETSKSSTPSSAEADRRLNGVGDGESAANTKIKTPICPTPPKAKNARRKSNAAPSPVVRTRERSSKNAVEKIESEASPVVRSSRRVAKPKKFDDFVLTENSPISVRRGDEAGTSEKPRSRRSSQNSESPQPTAKIPKKGAGEGNRKVRAEATVVEVGDATTPKKIDDFALRGDPPISGRVGDEAATSEKPRSRRSSLSSESSQPAAKIGKKGTGKADQRDRAEATVVRVGDEPVAKKRLEEAVSGEESSGVLKSPSENCFTVPDPPSAVRKKPLDGAREKQSPKATSSELGEKKSSLREDVFAVPKSPTTFAKKKFKPKLIQRATGEINVRERTVEKEELKISACEEGKSETKGRLPTSSIVSEDVEEKSLTTATVEPPTTVREHFDEAKPDPPSTSHKTEEVGSTRSDNKNKVGASKSMAPKSTDNIQETEDPKSDPLRQLSEDEKMIDLKSDPQSSARGNERAGDSELFPLNALDREAGGSKSDPQKSSDKRESTVGSKAIPRRSLGNTRETEDPKLDPLRHLDKEEKTIGSKSDPPSSAHGNEKTIGPKSDPLSSAHGNKKTIGSKSDPLSSAHGNKKTIGSKSDPPNPAYGNKKTDSEPLPPNQSDKTGEAGGSKSDLPRSSDEKQNTIGSKAEPLSSSEKRENTIVTKSDPLRSSDNDEKIVGTKFDTPSTSQKTDEVNSSKAGLTRFDKKNKVRVSKSIPRRSLSNMRRETEASKSDALRHLDKEEKTIGSKSDPPSSAHGNKKTIGSKSDPPSPAHGNKRTDSEPLPPNQSGKTGEAGGSKSDLPRSSDEKQNTIGSKAEPLSSSEKRENTIVTKSDPLTSSDNDEKIVGTKFDTPSTSQKTDEVNSSKAGLTRFDKKNKVRVSKSIPRRSLSNMRRETEASKSDALRHLDKEEKTIGSKSDPPSSAHGNKKTIGSKSDPPNPAYGNKKTDSEPLPPNQSGKTGEAGGSKSDLPRSSDEKQNTIGSKAEPLSSSEKRENTIVTKSDPLRSSDNDEKITGTKFDTPSTSQKTDEVNSSKAGLTRFDKKNKVRVSKSIPRRSLSNMRRETEASKSDALRQLDEEKIDSESDPPRPPVESAEARVSKSGLLESSDKNEVICLSQLESPISPHKDAESSSKDPSKSVDKKEEANKCPLDSPRSRDKTVESGTKEDIPKSSGKKDEAVGIVQIVSPRSPDKKEEVSISRTASPRSLAKKGEVGISQFGSPSSLPESEGSNRPKPDPLKSADKKENANVFPFASRRSREKTEESTKTVIPRSPEKKEKAVDTNTSEKNEGVGVSQFGLPRSPDKEEVAISESASPRSREKTEDRAKTAISRSSGKEENTASKSQITSSRCSDEKEVANSKFAPAKAQAKKEEVAISKVASPKSQAKKEVAVSEFASPRSQAKKEEVISEFASPRSQAKKEGIRISEFASPRSQAKKEGIRISEFASPRSQAKKEEVISEFASPRSQAKKEGIRISEFASPTSQAKKEEVISEFASPRSQAKKEGIRISEFASPRSQAKKEEVISEFASPRSQVKIKEVISELASLRSQSEREEVISEFASPRSQDKKEGIRISAFASPRSSKANATSPIQQSSTYIKEELIISDSDSACSLDGSEGPGRTRWSSSTSSDKRRVDSEFSDVQMNQDRLGGEQAEKIDIFELVSPRASNVKDEVDVFQLISPNSQRTSEEVFCAQSDVLTFTEVQEEEQIFFFDSTCTTETIEITEYIESEIPMSRIEAQTDSKLFDIRSEEDRPTDASTKIPSTNETFGDSKFSADNSLDGASWVEATHADDAISSDSAADESTESPASSTAYSVKGRLMNSSNSAESSSVIETDAPTETGSSEVVEAFSRKERSRKSSNSTESSSVIETDAPTEIVSTKVVEAHSGKEKSLKSSNSTESSSVIKTDAPRKTGSSKVAEAYSRKEKSLKSSNSTESSSVIETDAPTEIVSTKVVEAHSGKEKSLKSSNSTESSFVIKTDAPRKTGSSEVVEAFSRKEKSLKSSNSTESSFVIKTDVPRKTGSSEVVEAHSRKEKSLKSSNSTESSSVIKTDAPRKTGSSEVAEAYSRKEKSLKSSNSTESSFVIKTDVPRKTGSSEVVEAYSRKGKSLKPSNSTESSSVIEVDVPIETGSSAVVEAYSRKERSLKSSTESSSVIETDVPTETESSEVVETYSTKGRSLKPSNSTESSSVIETNVPTETGSREVVETPVGTSSRSKRSVRKMENVTDGKGLSDGSEDDAEKIEVKPRRRGRPPGVITQGPGRGRGRGKGRGRGRGRGRGQMDTEYVPRTTSSGKDKTATGDSGEVDDSPPAAIPKEVGPLKPGEVECGKCKDRMLKKNWTKHNLMHHNNMGWLSGDPEPDFEENVKLLRSILVAVLKKKKKGQLICETCGAGKRSANGFISHLQFCGKTEHERQSLMLTCPICKNVMMPSSMEMHERFHRQEEKAAEEKKLAEEKKKEEIVLIDPSSGRGKRKAAEKAATKILEFTDLVKEDEPANKKRRRTKDELIELIAKPQSGTNPPNRWKGMWKNEIAKDGKALCRQQGCSFTAESLEAICAHYPECTFSPRLNYVCKLCFFSSQTEEETMKHVEAQHSVSKSKETADSDFENTGSSSSSCSESELSDTKPAAGSRRDDRYQPQDYNVRFLDEAVKVDARWPFTYPPTLRWTMEFERKNYRLRLFEDFPPNPMRLLEHEESLEYLPELSRSMKIRESDARGTTPASWIQWERFEGTVTAGIPTFFAGGPVWAIAWLPIPAPMYDQAVDQFVAVSTHSTMESVYAVGKSYMGNNVVQIWNLGPLDHRKSTTANAPVLSYGVAHDKGTIWCMEWCPSGCYEDPSLLESEENGEASTSKRRMGLLAAACSDGCVHVFSLPFPEELEYAKNDDDSRLPIYRTEPILTLTISIHMYDQGEQNWQCTKLNWCRELGHDTIIAGFSNGHIAMWDLTSESPLFVTTRGETTFIDAFHHFYAHGHAISAVQMIPYGDKRFFVTSSYDRMTKLWDLEDTSFPVTGLKRGIVVDAAWLTHWPAYIAAYDDVLSHAHTYLISLRQPGAKIFPLLPTNSPTYSVATSDYGNSVSHGTLAGEVVVMFPNHLWSLKDMERLTYKKRWLATTVEVVDFESEKTGSKRKNPTSDYEYTPETYDGCKDRYGLVFRDRLNRTQHGSRKIRSKSGFSEKLKSVHVEQYPFASANRVSWNPNAWSYLWMCVAYQNGLVRFLNFNAVSLDTELQKLLPSHAKAMLNEARTFEPDSAGNNNTIDPSDSRSES